MGIGRRNPVEVLLLRKYFINRFHVKTARLRLYPWRAGGGGGRTASEKRFVQKEIIKFSFLYMKLLEFNAANQTAVFVRFAV